MRPESAAAVAGSDSDIPACNIIVTLVKHTLVSAHIMLNTHTHTPDTCQTHLSAKRHLIVAHQTIDAPPEQNIATTADSDVFHDFPLCLFRQFSLLVSLSAELP